MKKLMLGLAALVMAVGVYAKDSTKMKKSPEEMANKKADKLKTELNLSNEQRTSVYNAVLDKINKTQAIKAKYGDKGDKKAMRAEMRSVEENFEATMKGILSADQYSKWQTLKEEHKDKRKEKRSGNKTSPSNP
jgi:periplasmic protein CpxP/Spy